jgi:hypothetical protein
MRARVNGSHKAAYANGNGSSHATPSPASVKTKATTPESQR